MGSSNSTRARQRLENPGRRVILTVSSKQMCNRLYRKEFIMATQTRSEVNNDAAALGEQFRKTAEQTRESLGVAQQKIQENVSRAQQAQSDWAKNMFRLTEQNGQLAMAGLK